MFNKNSPGRTLTQRWRGITTDPITKISGLLRAARGMRAYRPRLRTTRLPGPLCVQVQTVDRCNAACVMCPFSQKTKPRNVQYMDRAMYSRLLGELAAAGTIRVFTPMLQNEPLMDPQIALRVREAREVLGKKASLTIVTNGSLLGDEMARKLLASGLDSISVSIDAYREDTYRAIRRGLAFSRVRENLHSLLRLRGRPQVIARFLKQRANEGEERSFVAYWRAAGAGVFIHSLTNRAGGVAAFDGMVRREVPPAQRLLHRLLSRMFPFCVDPFWGLNVLWDGRVILCCHDWGPEVVIGDLRNQTLSEIWNGEKLNACRHSLATGRGHEVPCCRNCTRRSGPWAPPPPGVPFEHRTT